MILSQFALSFTAVFVALDILGTLPTYIGITASLNPKARKHAEKMSIWVAFWVAIVFLFLGEAILKWLGITLFDFRIAGGIILLLVSLADLLGGPQVTHQQATGSTGIVPLAVPLITGPGLLTTLLLQIGVFGYTITVISLVSNFIIAWFVLRNSTKIAKIIGQDGMVVLSKIAALLLAAIAVSMTRQGIIAAIHAANAP